MSDINYSSSNESVATVDPFSGNVTLVGLGTTTITASCPETANHTAAEASYTLVVEENKPQPTTAEVAIVAKRLSKYYAATTSLNNYKLTAVEVKVQDGKVFYDGNEDIVWIWDEEAGTLADKNGNLLAVKFSDNVGLTLKNSDNTSWYIDNEKGIMNSISKNNNRSLLFHMDSGFDYYANSNIGNSNYSGAAQLLPIASLSTESVTTNQYGWATYAPSNKISIPSLSGAAICYISRDGLSGSENTIKTVVLSPGTVIERGTGVLVKTESPNRTVTFTESVETAEVINNALVGVTEATSLDGVAGAYIFTRKEIDGVGKIGFFPCSGGTLSANKCYLKMAEGQQAARFFAMPDSIASGIWSATEPVSRRRDSATYNICGQRVSGGYRGVVIKDGRKWLVR